MKPIALTLLLGTLACGASPTTSALTDGGPTDGGPTDGGSVSYDGTWIVTVDITACYDFNHTGSVKVTNGAFSGKLFTYCAVATNGATRIDTGAGCGADISEAVTISGTMAKTVEGNLTLTGGACNGANGFSGFMSSTTAG